jgi:hypothetical protein
MIYIHEKRKYILIYRMLATTNFLDTIYNRLKETIINIITPPKAGNNKESSDKKINKLIESMEEGKSNNLNEPLIGYS